MKRFTVHMLRGDSQIVYAYEFIKLEGDVAVFDIGSKTKYMVFGVRSVE